MGFPPEAYLIGAQKAGTTTLAYMLDQHPAITLSRPKEAQFFTSKWEMGLGWYRQLFHGPEQNVFIDATPGYSAAPIAGVPGSLQDPALDPRFHVARRIHEVRPDAKFIYSLRDPVDRTYSSYWHRVRTGEEKRGFREAIESESFYLRTSDYYEQIRIYLEYFRIDAFHFVLFEDLVDAPLDAARQCFEFLAVEPRDFQPRTGAARNRSYAYNTAGRLLLTLFPSIKIAKSLTKLVKTLTPRRYHQALADVFTRSIPKMKEEDRIFLTEYFRQRNEKLHCLTGVSIDRWQG